MSRIKHTRITLIIASIALFIAVLLYSKDFTSAPTMSGDYELEFDENVATMSIELKYGELERIDADPEHNTKAKAVYQMYDGSGAVIDEGSFTMNGHGNSTWGEIMKEFPDEEFKRSYNIDLGGKKSLLGMGAVKDYVLISGFFDESLIRNKIVFETAKALGCEYVPDSEFVNVYINGDYKGLYLLSQRIKSYEGMIELEDDGYLVLFDYDYRLEEKENHFETALCDGEVLSNTVSKQDYNEYVAEDITKAEISILKSSLTEEADYSEFIDEDSFARYFLMQEFFENQDGDRASTYVYKDSGSGLIKAGPIWDFDLTMSHSWLDAGDVEADVLWFDSYTNQNKGWLRALNKCPTFKEKVDKIYLEEFGDVLTALLTDTIPKMQTELADSWYRDRERWKDAPNYYEKTDHTEHGFEEPSFPLIVSHLSQFISDRKTFYDAYVGNKDDYYLITFDTSLLTNGAMVMVMPAKKEEPLGAVPVYEDVIVWEMYDGTDVTEENIALSDMYLTPKFEGEDEE
ncbi:CotH kinase family protein [Butyrivibrio proteoclasticus]|uniref:CotH kinase family protein n=1 Tax=Butyrivibrio proteoclasticus TaxID=43305 RepID=UPI000479BA87|nr:CotH kinase family protein [Butyrivibrio proteoclasticus]